MSRRVCVIDLPGLSEELLSAVPASSRLGKWVAARAARGGGRGVGRAHPAPPGRGGGRRGGGGGDRGRQRRRGAGSAEGRGGGGVGGDPPAPGGTLVGDGHARGHGSEPESLH